MNALAADQVQEAGPVPAQGEWVFGGQGQSHVFDSGTLQLAHHGTAFGGHQGLAARLLHRERDIDGGAFRPAGFQPGHHLQHDHGPTFAGTRIGAMAVIGRTVLRKGHGPSMAASIARQNQETA